MNITKKVLYATLALTLSTAMPVSAAVCASGSKASDCPASTAHKSDHKKDEKQAPAAVGTAVHSEGTADLGSASNHEHVVEVKVKEHKTESTASAPSTPDVKVKEQKTESMASVPTDTPQMPMAVDSHVKLHKYHEAQQHEVHVVEHGAPTARSLPVNTALPAPPASGAQPHVTYWYHYYATNDYMSSVSPLGQMEFRRRGWINPDGTVSEAGMRHGLVAVVDPQTPQLVVQTTPTLLPNNHPVLQTSANPPATTWRDFKYVTGHGHGTSLPAGQIRTFVADGHIGPDGSVTPSGQAMGIVAEPFRTNPVPHLATTSGPTPTPTQLTAPTRQGSGKQSKDQVPDFTAQTTPTPDPLKAPQMVQTSPAVPQQIVQTTPAATLRPADHSVPGISYFITESTGKVSPLTTDVQRNPLLTNPDGTLTPNALAMGITSQFQQPTLQGAGKQSKDQVPDFTTQTTPTPDVMQAPQMVQTTPAVPQQIVQTTPTTPLRPIDHPINPSLEYRMPTHSGPGGVYDTRLAQRNPLLTNPDGTLTPTAIAGGWTMQRLATPAPALLGEGKRAKDPVPDFTAQTTPTPDAIKVPQMVQTTNAVPQQIVQTTPTTPLRPADHPINPSLEYRMPTHRGPGAVYDTRLAQRNPLLTNPDGTLTPTAIAGGWTMQRLATTAPALLGEGKRAKDPVPEYFVQTGASPTLRPVEHHVAGITYAYTDHTGRTNHPPAAMIQRNPALTNPDGTLTPNAIAQGWTQTVQAPNMVPQPQATPNLQTPPQNPPQQQVPAAMTVQAPNMVPTQPVQQSVSTVTHSLHLVQKTNKPPQPTRPTSEEALAGTPAVARPHADHLVETYHPVKTGVYRYEEARQMKDDSFHLMVLGFREPM